MKRPFQQGRPEDIEQLGPRQYLISELRRLESRGWEIWILIAFAAAVLVLGFISFLVPESFWGANPFTVTFTLPPQVLFVFMILVVILALALVRREIEIRKVRLSNVSQLLESQSRLSNTMLDSVTHVFSRSFLRELLQNEISSAERNSRPLSLMMTDIDAFKEINDRLGHLTGDFVLEEVANILRSCIRGSDYIVRYGGDEFLLILPETDEAGSAMVQQRINQRLEQWRKNNRIGNITLRLSLGCHLHCAGDSADQALAATDSRMYGDKQRLFTPAPVPL